MKFVPAKKGIPGVPAATAATPKTPETEFRYLTPDEIKTGVVELSQAIFELVKSALVQRFTTPPGEPEITSADAMQVGIAAMAAAEGVLAIEALKAGLPVEKVREIHDATFTVTLRSQQ